MSGKSYWMWHYGEYEIFHTMSVHLRRQGYGFHNPAIWKLQTPYASVKFIKQMVSDGGYLLYRLNGMGFLTIDGKRCESDKKIEVPAGAHTIEIWLSNFGGLPAAFVESDVCPSDESWLCNHYAGEFLPVGTNSFFDDKDKNPEVFPFEYKNIPCSNKEILDDGVLYDFENEIFGFLNIVGTDENAKLGVFYGESREEALDTEECYLFEYVSGEKSYRLCQRAFRYVYIKGDTKNAEVFADFEFLPLEKKGDFKCDNSLFNKIYDVASYTFHLNCREGFLDGIKRDRWIWSGDALQSARINRYLFADKEIEQRTLIGLVGKSPVEQHINTILDYSLIWFIILDEHYMTYGDKEFLCRIYPMAKELLSFVETRLNSEGFLEGFDEDWTFVDWSPMDKCGAISAEQMLLIEAYRAMARISKTLGFENAKELLEKAEKLKEKIFEFYWNEEKGAFIDSYKSGKNNVTRHANIFAVMFGIATEEQAESILQNVLKNDEITQITTPYFKGYELDVLARLGELDDVEKLLDSYWGGMISLGATTVWEEYDPNMNGIEHYAMYGGKFQKSLCHAWGAGPIYLFGKYYLGVKATSPGYETFEVKPNLGGLDEINGTVPINDGYVSVSLNHKTLSVETNKSGGTLVWGEEKFPLEPNKNFIFEL